MSRFGTGFGFNKYNASLWGGGTETFTANVANFDGSTYVNKLNVQASVLNPSMTAFGWVDVTTDNSPYILDIGGTQAGNGQSLDVRVATGGILQATTLGQSNGFQGTLVMSAGFNFWAASFNGTRWKFRVNEQTETLANDPMPLALTDTMMFTIGARRQTFSNKLTGLSHSNGLAIGELTSADLDEMIASAGVARCYNLWSQTLKDKIHVMYPLYNHAGFVGKEFVDFAENEADSSSNPAMTFTGTAQIECEA